MLLIKAQWPEKSCEIDRSVSQLLLSSVGWLSSIWFDRVSTDGEPGPFQLLLHCVWLSLVMKLSPCTESEWTALGCALWQLEWVFNGSSHFYHTVVDWHCKPCLTWAGQAFFLSGWHLPMTFFHHSWQRTYWLWHHFPQHDLSRNGAVEPSLSVGGSQSCIQLCNLFSPQHIGSLPLGTGALTFCQSFFIPSSHSDLSAGWWSLMSLYRYHIDGEQIDWLVARIALWLCAIMVHPSLGRTGDVVLYWYTNACQVIYYF